MKNVQSYLLDKAESKLLPSKISLSPIENDEVEIRVKYCGICHSDLSMIDNDWGITEYPLVPGHEIVGEVVDFGSDVKGLKIGDHVGLGWFCGSCMSCHECLDGEQHLCGSIEETIVGRPGGFAEIVRGKWPWVTKLPDGMDLSKTGPLFCAGITVFNPIQQFVKPTDKVGVVGIGGLGHLAIQFLLAWGCEVYAFTSSESKKEELIALGVHHVVNSKSKDEIKQLKGKLNFILSTVNVNLEWNRYLSALSPKGRFHPVGMIMEPMEISSLSLMNGEKSISGSPLGNITTLRTMLEFCQRHSIYPLVEEYPMSKVNEGLDRLRSGKARYRVVLKADF